ncbi:MAG: hypothetical protein HY908_09890 [Myxococcales bacterium]|nr:hypothetical protein [Myxococcales bacterium]
MKTWATRKRRARELKPMIIAIEGKVTPTRTPALRAAVLGSANTAAPEHSTRFRTPMAAKEGHHCLVLGAKERRLAGHYRAAASPRVAEFGTWLDGPRVADERLGATSTSEGNYFVWICSPAEAEAVLAIVAQEAQSRLGIALRTENAEEVYANAFWLQRAALDARKWLLAAAALERAGHGDAATSLRGAALKHLPDDNREALRAAAEEDLQLLVTASAPQSSLRACANALRARQTEVPRHRQSERRAA